MSRPSAQHDLLDPRLPKSGVHDLDCKWLCRWNSEQHRPGHRDQLCPRGDHAPCRLCASVGVA